MILIEHAAVVQCAYRLPPLPQSAVRLAQLVSADDPDLGEIAKVIEFDATLTMKLLGVANSAVGGARHQVGTVREALLRLGAGTVAGFVIGTTVRSLVGKRIPGYNLPESDFWTHSLAAAFAAESIQVRSSKWTGRLAFTAALLHDIGKLVLGQFLNAELAGWLEQAVRDGRQSGFAAENEILSLNHADTGGIIAQHWGLPDCLVKGIVYHHDPTAGADEICHATYLANLIAHQLESEDQAGKPSEFAADDVGSSLMLLGLTEKDLVRVRADARKGLLSVSGQLG